MTEAKRQELEEGIDEILGWLISEVRQYDSDFDYQSRDEAKEKLLQFLRKQDTTLSEILRS